MPLFDFRCQRCAHEFEKLVRPQDDEPACPACGAKDPVRLASAFAVKSAERTRAFADASNKRAAAVARQENMAREREIERHRAEDH
jgi:putative FmdB family regulatory protein